MSNSAFTIQASPPLVTSVTNADGSLTFSPTSGSVIGSVTAGAIGATQLAANPKKRDIGFSVDGSGTALTSGGTWILSNIPFSCTITGWCIVADQSGSIVIDVWKTNLAVPTVANTITASSLPTLSSAQSAFNGSIAGWTTSVAAGDVFAFKINSVSTITKVNLTLQVTIT